MKGVISLLDDEHTQRVKYLWAALKQQFDLAGAYGFPYPHFSYDVAIEYDQAQALTTLAEIAEQTRPFTITTTGIGIFTTPIPVVYLAITRNPTLNQLHHHIYTTLTPVSQGRVVYYSPEQWVSHISLAVHDTKPNQLGPIIDWLRHQKTRWQIPINNLAYVDDSNDQQISVHTRYPLKEQ